MTWQDIYLICFVAGLGWTLLTLLMGSLHLHLPHLHGHGPSGLHAGHAAGAHAGGHHGAGHAGTSSASGHGQAGQGRGHLGLSWMSSLLNPSAFSIFLAWFGGAGYLLTRGALLTFWLVLGISMTTGLAGALGIAWVMRLVTRNEKPLDPADYEMVGVLGTVTSPVRPGGVGEMVYVREGARRPLAVKAERNQPISPGTEVVVTRFENGIALVRTWIELEQSAGLRGLQQETGEGDQ
jgi:membrane protein implicated in regulation of membrane protease activity